MLLNKAFDLPETEKMDLQPDVRDEQCQYRAGKCEHKPTGEVYTCLFAEHPVSETK